VTRLIIDCDTGTDDAVAIMAAVTHPDLDLVAVTTVNGNVPLSNTTENSLRVLDYLGSTVPVYAGSPRPMVRADFPVPRDVLNGDKPQFQIPYLDLPPSVTPVREQAAVAFLIDYYMDDANTDTVLVATGPLTNVALALAAEPRLAQRIPQLVLMGGARGWGNVTAVAEFNIWVDPEAAESVLSAGIRDVVMVPLDATHSAQVSLEDCDAFDAIGTPAATASASIIRHRIVNYPDAADAVRLTAPVHDAICVAFLTNPEVLEEFDSYPVRVETAGTHTVGETVIDMRPWSEEPRNARVALRANAQVFVKFLSDAFAS
jgi:inosine-uridine nucleoside N-ribohydrolase